MGKRPPHVTAAELRILKVLWKSAEGMTVRDVKVELDAQDDEPSAYTTVMTLMNQLAQKGGLSVDRSRQPFVYRPAVRREQIIGDRIRQFIHQVFDGQAGELVLRLVEEAELSPDDLKRIEQQIEQREREDAARGRRGSSGGKER